MNENLSLQNGAMPSAQASETVAEAPLNSPATETLTQPEVALGPELEPEKLSVWGMSMIPDEFKNLIYGQYSMDSKEYKLAHTTFVSIVGMTMHILLSSRVTSEQEKTEWTRKVAANEVDEGIQSALLEVLKKYFYPTKENPNQV